MKNLILIVVCAFSSGAMAFGFKLPGIPVPIPVPTPWNPIPICQSCACGNAEMCARDARNAAAEADRIRRAAEDEAAKQAQSLAKNVAQAATTAVEFVGRDLERERQFAQNSVAALGEGLKDPAPLRGLEQAGKKIVEDRVQTEIARTKDVVQTLVQASVVGKIRERQVLIIVSELERYAERNKELYKVVQQIGIPMAQGHLSQWYGDIIVIEKNQATPERLRAAIEEATGRSKVKAVDVFVFLHGLPNRLAFYEGDVQTADLSAQLQSVNSHGKLRLLYSTACYGASHIQDWLNAGFKVAIGARGVNSNAATEYPAFLNVTASGAPFSVAIAAGNSPLANLATDKLAKMSGLENTDSEKNVGGDLSEGFLSSATKWMLEDPASFLIPN